MEIFIDLHCVRGHALRKARDMVDMVFGFHYQGPIHQFDFCTFDTEYRSNRIPWDRVRTAYIYSSLFPDESRKFVEEFVGDAKVLLVGQKIEYIIEKTSISIQLPPPRYIIETVSISMSLYIIETTVIEYEYPSSLRRSSRIKKKARVYY